MKTYEKYKYWKINKISSVEIDIDISLSHYDLDLKYNRISKMANLEQDLNYYMIYPEYHNIIRYGDRFGLSDYYELNKLVNYNKVKYNKIKRRFKTMEKSAGSSLKKSER